MTDNITPEKVERFNPKHQVGMRADPEGMWVRYDDYAAISARVAEAKATQVDALMEALIDSLLDTASSLAAAISLLERGGKKAAPSNKMFAQTLFDYNASLERARATLAPFKDEKNG